MIKAKSFVTLDEKTLPLWLGGNAVRISHTQCRVGGFMTSSETASAVQALIESYLAAFERLDAAAIADHFAYPSHITSDAEVVLLIPIANRKECLAAMDKVVVLHRKLGAPCGPHP
jgi:hypothetical protein